MLRLDQDYTFELLGSYYLLCGLGQYSEQSHIIKWGFYSNDDKDYREPTRGGFRVYFARDKHTIGRQALPTVFTRLEEAKEAALDRMQSVEHAIRTDNRR